jgi:hypothetical protein
LKLEETYGNMFFMTEKEMKHMKKEKSESDNNKLVEKG